MEEMKLKRIIKKQRTRTVYSLMLCWAALFLFFYITENNDALFVSGYAMAIVTVAVVVILNFVEKVLISMNHAEKSDD